MTLPPRPPLPPGLRSGGGADGEWPERSTFAYHKSSSDRKKGKVVNGTKVAIAPLTDFSPGVPMRIEGLDRPVVLVRIGDSVYGLEDRCSHQDVPLSEGSVWVEDREI